MAKTYTAPTSEQVRSKLLKLVNVGDFVVFHEAVVDTVKTHTGTRVRATKITRPPFIVQKRHLYGKVYRESRKLGLGVSLEWVKHRNGVIARVTLK